MKSCAGVWLSKRLPLIDTPRSENLESHDSIAMLRMWLQHEVWAFKRSVPKLDVTNVFDTAFTISYDTEEIACSVGKQEGNDWLSRVPTIFQRPASDALRPAHLRSSAFRLQP